MSAPLDAPPWIEQIADRNYLLRSPWVRWLQLFYTRVKAAIALVGTPVSLTNQSATIATTGAYTVTQNGRYRISTYLRVTVADGVSSSATLTLTWRENSQTLTKSFAAVTGDTVTTVDSQTWVVQADSGTVISYGIVYASNTAQKMRFLFDLTVEQVV